MELIVINENKLKIMMNESEMRHYGLDENDFYSSATNARRILDNILSASHVYTGFEAHRQGERILLQLYSAQDGGCELFVTKIPLEEDYISKEEVCSMPPYNDDKHLLPSAKARQVENKKITLAYRFDTIEHVKQASASLLARSFEGDSSLHRSNEGRYYLFVKLEGGKSEKCSPSSYLSEFGELENAENAAMYVGEYGSCVYEKSAISKLNES